MPHTVIQVNDLSKQYRLGEVGTGTLSHDLKRWWYRMRGKEDPYLKIGEINDRTISGSSEYVWALRDINFEVKQGEVLGIIGRNGAGKSTLLKILSKTTAPTTGQIKIRGRIASLLEVGTGFHPELTGRENIFLNGAILGMTKREIRKKFDEIVDFAGVERYVDTPVKRYSSGMYVRLAFAVAAHLEPEILIVDEVLAVGDAEFQKKCVGKMKDVSVNEGRTVLFVSHNMGVIAQLCKNAMLLRQGKIETIDNVKKVVEQYIFNEERGNSIYINLNSKKKNYFTRIFLTNKSQEIKNDFLFDESIVINFDFHVGDNISGLQIGIGLNDKFQNRVFTILKPVSFFHSRNEDGSYYGSTILPNSLIAPNLYNIVLALWTKSGEVFDFIDTLNPVKIFDNGTDLALYEGGDHGFVIVNPTWLNDKENS